jgi:hypothetical protein
MIEELLVVFGMLRVPRTERQRRTSVELRRIGCECFWPSSATQARGSEKGRAANEIEPAIK